ncbi:MAG: sulfite exporter TauE/SafE family protein, partial [Geodermatophilaceae bacterium]|nr:sulfite exporter TauE/SafE family protein [Geodermatophilaceae bacterium]
GVTGTATSIGGPPMALLYQRREPDQSRATLGVYFLVGAILSLVGLALTGQLQARDGVIALALSPVLVLAFLLSGLLRRRVRARTVRAGMLSICAIGAAVLVVRNVI